MDTERDEMFRLTRIRMQNFKVAAQLAKQGGGAAGGANMGTENKKGKKGSNNTPNTSVNGCALALASLTVYTRILTTLECMLRVGCCTGAVELDLAGLFPVNRAVLGINLNTHAQAHGTEQKMLLPGPTGIAPADLLLVAMWPF